jgi:predicted metalloprotease with PDZ domain
MKTASHSRRPAPVAAAVHYRVAAPSPHDHLFSVHLEIARPAARQRLSLPVWIPGSYLVREFSQHLQGLRASQDGRPVPVTQTAKNTWVVHADPARPLQVDYEAYAFDASVRTAYLDRDRGFFNGTSLCPRVHGQEERPHALRLAADDLPADWSVATALTPASLDERGRGDYVAADYDELVDAPVVLGAFWSGRFEAGGVPHRFVVSGAPAAFDGERLLADTRRICEAQIRFWHGDEAPPFDRYLFLLHATGDGYGGLEHRHSTALMCQRSDLPVRGATGQAALKATDGYTSLLGLISHEYFHAWNVKRLRPAEFARYDYEQENYTELLWFFEGFTSYYDDLMLRRAGLIDDATYLQLLARNLNQVLQTPGRFVQSVAQASFDAWVKYYRVGENTPNATVSYYGKGALVALCLDLTLRREGHATLDDVMRELWRRTGGGPMKELDVARALRRLGRRDYGAELAAWVHGTADLPAVELLRAHGVRVETEPAPLAQRLGLRVTDNGQGIAIRNVLRGGAAERGGLAAGDEWLGVELPPPRRGARAEAWRLRKLDELPLLLGPQRRFTALVARDRRLLRCPMTLPDDVVAYKLAPGEGEALRAWLTP